jgi:hypothetical protein
VESIESAALARNDRYLREFVEALELCPFARKCRETGRLARYVFRGSHPTEATLTAIAELERTAEDQVEVALLIYSEFIAGLAAFEEFRDEVRTSLRLFYGVAFHPELPVDLSDANRAVSFLRRSPDPTLQLVRIATLERVRAGRPTGTLYVDPARISPAELSALHRSMSVSDEIAEANLRTLRTHNAAELERMLTRLRAP